MFRRAPQPHEIHFPCYNVTLENSDALNRYIRRLKDRGFRRVPASIADAYLHGYNDCRGSEKDEAIRHLVHAVRLAKGYMVRAGADIELHYPEIFDALHIATKLGF